MNLFVCSLPKTPPERAVSIIPSSYADPKQYGGLNTMRSNVPSTSENKSLSLQLGES
jgi:hypothetical protein